MVGHRLRVVEGKREDVGHSECSEELVIIHIDSSSEVSIEVSGRGSLAFEEMGWRCEMLISSVKINEATAPIHTCGWAASKDYK